MRLKHYKKETENLHCELDGTDRSSRLDRNVTKRKTESLQCQLDGTDRSLWLDQNVTKGNREFHSHLGETEIPIGKTEFIRVYGNGYVK